ncbi:PQQ-binding-like beta-propeller repeat protein [Gordonia phosphorivorans]|uniref:PQQ-binding-like beta-propeller repeat protein n=1 Tax=Gordonia phosphorivorans TaxID=1056982 RepID=A0ABV6H8B8_9ACTN
MQQSAGSRLRRGRTLSSIALVAIIGLMLTACSDGHTEVRAIPAAGWPTYGGDGANSNYTPVTAPDDLALAWTRPTGGPISAPLTMNALGDIGVTANTGNGCNMFVFDHAAGRKNFCKRMTAGVELNAMAFDQNSQPYLGESSTFLAFNGGGSIRWRMPVIGVPVSAKFAGPGRVLMVTTQGQILLINAQTNAFETPEVRLRPDARPDEPLFGLGDCVTGGPLCAVSAPPAVDAANERFYLNFRPEGTAQSQLSALTYAESALLADGGKPTDVERQIIQRWHVEVPGGMVGPPTVSADGTTVYAFGRDGRLYAYDAADGSPRWNHDLGGFGFATLAVSPDGVLIPTGTVGAPLTILKDTGDGAEVIAERTDLETVSLSTITGGDRAWTVVRTGADQKLMLTEVSTSDGATLRSLELPNAAGFTTGIAVSAWGSVAVATHAGEVFYFSPR